MGRDAKKARGNPWYEARMRAAKRDERFRSREGAGEVLGMSACAIADAELGQAKFMPVEKAYAMAKAYRAPNLLNHYCLYECPIGRHRALSEDTAGIERATVRFLREMKLERLEQAKNNLLDIAEDGAIAPEEMPKMERTIRYLERVSRAISELKLIWDERVLTQN